jgi:hypothetical protein
MRFEMGKKSFGLTSIDRNRGFSVSERDKCFTFSFVAAHLYFRPIKHVIVVPGNPY